METPIVEQDEDKGAVSPTNKVQEATKEEIANGFARITLTAPLVLDGKTGTVIKVATPLAAHRYKAVKLTDNFTLQFMEIALMVGTLEIDGRDVPLTREAFGRLSYFDTLRIEKKLLDLAGF